MASPLSDDPFPVLTVPDDATQHFEPLGTKDKFWFDDAASGRNGLFKRTRPETGEDWAECVVADVAAALGLPHADYDLALHRGERGVVSWNFLTGDQLLLHGNEILGRSDHSYDGASGPAVSRRNPYHTVRRVLGACSIVTAVPPAADAAIARGDDTMVGYLLLDALVCNTDRHHENWAWVVDPEARLAYLAPTFDHGSSLGRNESDEKRLRRLRSRDQGFTVRAYALRAKSGLFGGSTGDREPAQLRAMDAFRAAARLRPAAARCWLKRLEVVDDEELRRIARRVPRSVGSEVVSDFAGTMMSCTRADLLKTT